LVGAINIISKESNGTKTKVTEFKISALDMVSSPVNVNSVSIAGRVGRDPEVRYFESGTNKTSCSLAVRRTSQTDWFDLEAWGKTGEVMGNYVRKGGLIGILGQIKFEEWTDKSTGELRSKPVILVGELELLGGKKEQEQEDF
jgi:single-strand DNA-binding protein